MFLKTMFFGIVIMVLLKDTQYKKLLERIKYLKTIDGLIIY